MKRFFAALFAVALSATAATEDDLVAMRADALELAGAWSNDGFKIRDGHWSGELNAGEPKLVQVNLFAGNRYWFTAAAGPRAKELKVSVFDESGKPVAFDPYASGTRAAAGFSPTVSGPYYVQVASKEGAHTGYCLIYSYK
jgi:hypothetical protein